MPKFYNNFNNMMLIRIEMIYIEWIFYVFV